VGRALDTQPASRVVEEPRSNLVAYFSVAILAAGVVWTMQQRSAAAGRISTPLTTSTGTQFRTL
jgi:hypothetical protein